ncbi:MAG: hypothetical protein CXR30_03530 [Geobacter sp.]|nr:MAG: hypothetical protein CXR30_03530 [Geobacter sp.]
MKHKLRLLVSAAILFVTSTSHAAQDDLMDKINRLEQQIQELKAIKAQQDISAEKETQCLKAVDRKSFCKCVSDNLPPSVNFETYIHILVTPKDKLGYDSMSAEQKSAIDTVLAVREKCVEKGFFK